MVGQEPTFRLLRLRVEAQDLFLCVEVQDLLQKTSPHNPALTKAPHHHHPMACASS